MISVVICTHNGVSRLPFCLSGLINQENPPKFEIILVDNASSDETSKLAIGLLKEKIKPGESWRLIKEEKLGLVYARLAGLRAARFDWVLFCDDDNVLFQDFLSKSETALLNSPQIGVLGSQGIPEFLGPKPVWFDLYQSSFAVGEQKVLTTTKKHFVHVYGACSFYRKKPLLNLFDHGFSPVLSGRKGKRLSAGDDVEWCWLMQLMGYKIAFDSNLKFHHRIESHRLNWDYYIKLKKGISYGGALLLPYKFFYEKGISNKFYFNISYLGASLKSFLSLVKNSFRLMSGSNRNRLLLNVLVSKFNSMLFNWRDSFIHFKQLLEYFGSSQNIQEK